MDNFDKEVNQAFRAGLRFLETIENRASATDIEALASFKNIVRMVLNGAIEVKIVQQSPQQNVPPVPPNAPTAPME